MSTEKPLPVIDHDSAPYWQAAHEGRLDIPLCGDCGKHHFYPRAICPYCHSNEIEWIEGSGEGRIATFAVQHRSFGPWAEEIPYVTAYVDLNEGDRMLTVLRGVDGKQPEAIRVGARVRVEFEEANEHMHIPFWRVVEEDAQ